MSENRHNRRKPLSPLKILRMQAGLTQADLALKLSVNGKTVSGRAVRAWEAGDHQPELTVPQMKALCNALDVTLNELPDDFGRRQGQHSDQISKVNPPVMSLDVGMG